MEASTAPRSAALPASRASGLRSQRLLRLASDERLVSLVRAGNQSAFETIYDRHHRPLLSFCRHMLSDRGESEDAVQHTFIAAYNDMAGSEKPIQLRAWLYTIARNRCLTMLRARREQPTGEDLEVATEGLADEVQRRSDLQQLLGDMRELPEDQRAALVLAEVGALSHDEIAEVVGVPKAKVKALVFQARSSLIATRDARDMSCQTVREELSTARGGVLRRGPLRRHLAACEGCSEFAGHVKRQRAALAIVLPVVPTLGLKHGALSAVIGAGAAGGGGAAGIVAAGGGVAFFGTKGLAAKVLIGTAIAAGGTAGTAAVVQEINGGGVVAPVRAEHVAKARGALRAGSGGTVAAVSSGSAAAASGSKTSSGAAGSGRSAADPATRGHHHASAHPRSSTHPHSPAHRPASGGSTSHPSGSGSGKSGSPAPAGAATPGGTSTPETTGPSESEHGRHHRKHHHRHHFGSAHRHHFGSAHRRGEGSEHGSRHVRGRSRTAPGHLREHHRRRANGHRAFPRRRSAGRHHDNGRHRGHAYGHTRHRR